MAMKLNKNYDVNKVISKLIYTILGLYVGGTVLTTFGTSMNCSYSPFYTGLSLIGWTVEGVTSNGTTFTGTCSSHGGAFLVAGTLNNVITDTSGAGVLAVVGIIAIANVVMSFISFR